MSRPCQPDRSVSKRLSFRVFVLSIVPIAVVVLLFVVAWHIYARQRAAKLQADKSLPTPISVRACCCSQYPTRVALIAGSALSSRALTTCLCARCCFPARQRWIRARIPSRARGTAAAAAAATTAIAAARAVDRHHHSCAAVSCGTPAADHSHHLRHAGGRCVSSCFGAGLITNSREGDHH